MYIAVCDDSSLDREYIAGYINKTDFAKKTEIFSNPEELLKKLKTHSYDIIFLDIFMSSMNGIEAAKAIRQLDSDVHIVFITSSDKFVHEAFLLYATDYIIKPFKTERLTKTLQYIFEKKINSVSKVLEVKTHDSCHYIKMNDIIFIEESCNNCIIHTKQTEIKSNSPLEHFESVLNKDFFARSHPKYIANKQKVSHIRFNKGSSSTIHFNNTHKTALVSKEKWNKLLGP